MGLAPGKSRRAERFPIRLGVRYRAAGNEEWYEGDIENISVSGVLFETERPLAVSTPIELRFLLPATMDELSAEVVCRGQIVRTVPTSKGRKIPAVAATIRAYRFRRRGSWQNA
jgi:PilZ domain